MYIWISFASHNSDSHPFHSTLLYLVHTCFHWLAWKKNNFPQEEIEKENFGPGKREASNKTTALSSKRKSNPGLDLELQASRNCINQQQLTKAVVRWIIFDRLHSR